jgi:hypothetical protein
MTTRRVIGICAAIALALSGSWPLAAFQSRPTPVCKPVGAMMRLDGLPEASGLVASRASEGRLWAHNDSGKPEIFALDAKGKVAGRVALSGSALQDWEAMASAPCEGGSCLYVADIGDNDAKRAEILIYRLREPASATGSAAVDGVFRATYPDGAQNAEALLAAPDGSLFIVTKGDTGPVALYRFPRDLRAGARARLERVGQLSAKQSEVDARITDGAMSHDGEWVVLRSRSALMFYPAPAFLKGDFREAHRMDLRSLGEPQGEGVAFGGASTVYVGGEGGGKSQPGTLAVLSCSL